MFQKTAKGPNKLIDFNENELLYIVGGQEKINSDISRHQYFANFIEPDYNISSQFAIRSRDDERFQTDVGVLMERETEMRQGTFNPNLYQHHLENNDPQNSITPQSQPQSYQQSHQQPHQQPQSQPKHRSSKTKYPKTPANPHNRSLYYMNLNNSNHIQNDNRLNSTPIYETNNRNIYHSNVTAPGRTSIIKYNNTLFTLQEKQCILQNNLSQKDIDPVGLLTTQAYTIGSLLNKYKSFNSLYSKDSPIYSHIVKAYQQLHFIVTHT